MNSLTSQFRRLHVEDKILCKNLTSSRVISTEEAALGLKAPVKGRPQRESHLWCSDPTGREGASGGGPETSTSMGSSRALPQQPQLLIYFGSQQVGNLVKVGEEFWGGNQSLSVKHGALSSPVFSHWLPSPSSLALLPSAVHGHNPDMSLPSRRPRWCFTLRSGWQAALPTVQNTMCSSPSNAEKPTFVSRTGPWESAA